MTISSNYITMQRQIADELGDNQQLLAPLSDSALATSPIQNAIQQAIAKWEREIFYFNEIVQETFLNQPSYPWLTSSGQEYYSDSSSPQAWSSPQLSTIAEIKKLWVFISSNRYFIYPRTFEYMADVSVNPAVIGYPTDYAYAAQQIRFYPIPDGTYPIGFQGTQRFAPLVNGTDSNAWTNDAYDLIRSEAKLQLARDVLYDAEATAAATAAIYGAPNNPRDRGFLYALKGEGTRRRAKGKIIPSHF